jgi:hypothetical protein
LQQLRPYVGQRRRGGEFVVADAADPSGLRLDRGWQRARGCLSQSRTAVMTACRSGRLVALGAIRVCHCDPELPMIAGHIVMTEPEGNEFCQHS